MTRINIIPPRELTDNHLYCITYTGAFGFIKPFDAIRDELICSQRFVTPSILKGIEQFLFPNCIGNKLLTKICRHKLQYDPHIDFQTEKTRSIDKTKSSILKRGILINPTLILGFDNNVDATYARQYAIKLTRNEDILLPNSNIITYTDIEFNELDGVEIFDTNNSNDIWIGYDRFNDFNKSYIKIDFK